MHHIALKADENSAEHDARCDGWQRLIDDFSRDIAGIDPLIERLENEILATRRTIADLEGEKDQLRSLSFPLRLPGGRSQLGRGVGEAVAQEAARMQRILEIDQRIANILSGLRQLEQQFDAAAAKRKNWVERRLEAVNRAAREGCATIIGR